MNYKSYQSMRNATWRILLDSKVNRLPVDIDAVCGALGVCVLSYDAGAEIIERAHLYRAVRDANGLTFYLRDAPVILFNERQELRQVLFTIAHELGHIILNHVRPGGGPAHPRADWRSAQEERAADQFAARLLAPACVLWGLNLRSPEEIMALCQLTRPAAEDRARRMAALYRRQKFLSSPLERRLYHQFFPYIHRAAPAYCPGA